MERNSRVNYLIVVDMQEDFVRLALGTADAEAVLPKVTERVEKAIADGETVIFTRDTHYANYLETAEGKKLPVPHCIKGSEGWQIVRELREVAGKCKIIDKVTFGSPELAGYLTLQNEKESIGKIELVGVCTDICVISNALIIKAALPETVVEVNATCCAGATGEGHENALAAMKVCQIDVIR